jgi:hypothetical protein
MAEGGYPLSQFQRDRSDATKAASDQARNLGLAGIAIVWLFAGPFFKGADTSKPSDLLFFAGAMLSLSLALDLGQLVARALMLDNAYNRTERLPDIREAIANDEDPQVGDVGKGIHRVTRTLFFAKMVGLALGYGAILLFFFIKAF